MTQATDSSAVPAAPSSAYGWYVVVLLMMIFSVNILDRQVINIVAEDLKRDLSISDTQLGLLTGTSFAIFYSVLGIPIARLADRYSRRGVLSIAVPLWSLLTMGCSIATGYVQLFLLRLGVGVGEAGGTPPSQSLISDYIPQARRSLAMSVFNFGLPFGSFLGFLIGGIVNQAWGWRASFLVAGIPGLLLFLLIRVTLKEPVRGQIDGLKATAPLPLGETWRAMFTRRSYLWLILGSAFAFFIVSVTNAWLTSLFLRLHGMNTKEFGLWIAFATGVGGAIGVLGGGLLADRLRPRFPRIEAVIPTLSTLVSFPILLFTVLNPDRSSALLGMCALYTVGYMWIGPTSALVQRVAPIRARALANGMQLATANIFALMIGAPLVGYFSDLLRPSMGLESIRYALTFASVSALLASVCYFMASRYLLSDAALHQKETYAA